ncbi:fimbrial biogenesis chaperone [Proteus vulgaris]|uniref:Fimbria/pilus periplasmic chaperone n=1 Tax=Proteus vulgaris TaxID=585 RepID=A0A6G6SI90_PROVU|nr:molecular chaperone [Proteus vulgaris]QIF93541.1 fimbria/pilus periplasmic chaperone [Proteus vulgaris]WIF73538.1 molecular chaperone [Proteus vulgaris]CRL63105.1 Chaperone protein FimC precursor [Proteus vulgaris]
MFKNIKTTLFLAICFILPTTAQASVVLESTRIIYIAKSHGATITVQNPDPNPYLIQSWIGNENSDAPLADPLFITTPPLFRLDAEQSNTLRIVQMENKGELPKDKQSVFWLNVKAIPASNPDATNTLLISINSRIKLFYTPEGLSQNDFDLAYKNLKLSVSNNQLHIENPTPYYVTFSTLSVGDYKFNRPEMLSPESNYSWNLPNGTNGKITWNAVNSYGGLTELLTK